MKTLILLFILTAGAFAAPPPKTTIDALKKYPIRFYKEAEAENTYEGDTRIKAWMFIAMVNDLPYPLVVPQASTAQQIKNSYFTLSCAIQIIQQIGAHAKPSPSPEQQNENPKQNI